MVNPHCDPDWFLLRRTSIGPSLILNTLRRKKKPQQHTSRVGSCFALVGGGLLYLYLPNTTRRSCSHRVKRWVYTYIQHVRRIYIGADASTGECQRRIMSSVPPPPHVRLFSEPWLMVLKQRIEILIYFVIWRRDLWKVEEICVTDSRQSFSSYNSLLFSKFSQFYDKSMLLRMLEEFFFGKFYIYYVIELKDSDT